MSPRDLHKKYPFAIFLNADKGGASGSAAAAPPAPVTLTLEQRLSKAETDLSAAESLLAQSGLDLTAAKDRETALASQISSLTTERDTEKTRATNLDSQLSTLNSQHSSLVSVLKDSLSLNEEQVGKVKSGDATVIATAIDAAAQRKAVDIAAAQGTPAVNTNPGASTTPAEEIAQAFAEAAKIEDPTAKAHAFAAASKKLAAQQSKN